MKTDPVQNSFNGGIFGPRLQSRSDIARYRSACRSISNFIPTAQGPIVKRTGTRFVRQSVSASSKSRLIPFEFALDQAYVLELADGKIRFLRNSGSVLEATKAISGDPDVSNPCEITTTAAHGYSTGDQVFVSGSSIAMINSQYFSITVTGATTFTVPADTSAESIAGGPGTVARVYQLADGVSGNSVPWSEADIPSIQYAQDADVMYLVHPDYPPHKLARTSDTSWTCSEVVFKWPPFREENTSDVTIYAGAATGTAITVTASAATFTSSMVGGYLKIGEVIESWNPAWITDDTMALSFGGAGIVNGNRVRSDGKVYEVDKNGGTKTGTMPPIHDEGQVPDSKTGTPFLWTFINRGFGYGKITGFTSSTVVTVNVNDFGVEFPASVIGSSKATKKWAIGAFSADSGYPPAVAFFEGRLAIGGTAKDPQSLWISRTNRYEDFEIIADEDDSSISLTIQSNKVNAIQWMTGEDALIIGTRGAEFTVQSNSIDEGLTPTNVRVKQRSAFGSATNSSSKFIDSALMVVHRDGKRLYELIIDRDTDRYSGLDLTALAPEILEPGAFSIAYQASPYRQLYVLTSSDQLKALTYIKEEDVIGWTSIELGGPNDASVESIAVIPHPNGESDQVWIVARRTIGVGTFLRTIEYFETPFGEDVPITTSWFLDCGSQYSGSSTTVLTGLLAFAGLTMSYLSGASTTGTALVTSKGKMTIPASTLVKVGFSYVATAETMDFESGDPPTSSSRSMRSRVVSASFQLHNNGTGFQYSNELGSATFDEFDQTGTDLYTGHTPVLTIPGGFGRGARVAVKHATPFPCTLLAIHPTIEWGEG